MSRQRLNQILGKSRLSSIRERAMWLTKMNECLARQLPLSINTEVKLVNVDTRQRAILHVSGGEWATQVRMQQRMILSILKACGIDKLSGVVVKSRPASLKPVEPGRSRRPRRQLSTNTRDLLDSTAASVKDEKLRDSLKRLARKTV